MNKNRILVLICGQLRNFSKKNYENLIKNFKNYELDFFIVCWEKHNSEVIKSFNSIYKPIAFKEIKNKNFSLEAKNIKVPDTAVNTENTFHMWHAFSEACKEIKNFIFQKKFDYVLRYRSDILPDENQIFKFKSIRKKGILIPDRYHWNGINDQFFIFNFSDLSYFASFNDYINQYKEKKSLFSSELIFQRFLKEKKFKISFIDYNYKIMRNSLIKSKKLENNKRIKIPLIDKITVKFNKLKFRIRNFKNFYINKTNRNNQQNIIIK